MVTTNCDVVVIGAGAVGENAAAGAAREGLSVVAVEAELVGGECSYWACMPSKTLLNPGKLLELVRREPGIDSSRVGFDIREVLARRDGAAANWDDAGQVSWLEKEGVALQRGWARLDGERRVTVVDPDGEHHDFEAEIAVVIASGSTPRYPDIEGLDEVDTWDSRDATSAESVPDSLIVIGGGVVGAEMAQAWNWLGASVTLVQSSPLLLATEEPFVGEELRAALEQQGIRVLTDADTESVEERADGSVLARVRLFGEEVVELEADEVLIATGRRARTTDLGLETIGLEPGEFIEVDRHMQATAVPDGWLYAVGDVNGKALFTHMGKYQARIAAAHLTGASSAAVSEIPAVPRAIFTSPEVAAVGLTEAQARDAGIDVATVSHDIGRLAAATTLGEGYSGTCQLVIDRARQVVVGATFVGPRTSELIHAATISIAGEVPLARLWHAVPAFPTLSEIWLRLLEAYRDSGWDPYST